jgi:eukaryotic-like serine/threonine-protein kinase
MSTHDSTASLIGETVSHYHILREVGHGGMGVVYQARDLRLGRFVALKFPGEERAPDTRKLEGLREEARIGSTLNHPGICVVYDLDTDHEQPFIVMEFIEGKTLRQRLRQQSLSVAEVLDYGIQIADALESAHAKGIVHRDINPSNLFLTPAGRIKLLDFGIAMVVSARGRSATLAGTVCYMSPEQVSMHDIDARSDLFSVGVVLYEMLTGCKPFAGANLKETLHQIVHVRPRAMRDINPGVPPEVEVAVNRCLRKQAAQRFQSAAELRLELSRLQESAGRSESLVSGTGLRSLPAVDAELTETLRDYSADPAATTAAGSASKFFTRC